MTVLLPQLVANIDEVAHGQRDIEAAFRSIMRNRLDLATRYASLCRILIQEVPLHAELRAIFREVVFGTLFSQVEQVFNRFIEAGELRPVSTPRLARTGLSLVIGYFVARQLLATNTHWDDEEEIDFMVDVVLRGLGGPALASGAEPRA